MTRLFPSFIRASSAAVAIALIAGIAATPAMAAAPAASVSTTMSEPNDDALRLQVMVNGERVEVVGGQLSIEEPSSPADGEVTPQLINFDQWYRCFTLNKENEIFAEFTHYWDGIGHDANLKCGTASYGYKHIRTRHEAQWQTVLNRARSLGWQADAQGIESWDDLMAAAAGSTILWPEYKGNNAINKTACGVTEIFLYNVSTGKDVYSFRTRAAWATDKDRLLTAFPQTGQTCPGGP